MNNLAHKLGLAPWTYGQPVTKLPPDAQMAVSDLFLWRGGYGWETYFDLININAVISADLGKENAALEAEVRIMDMAGNLLRQIAVPYGNSYWHLFNVSEQVSDISSGCGTFCVIHPVTTNVLSKAGAFLAERGYVSFRRGSSALRSYVHGNLDAVSARIGQPLVYLGGTSILGRKYWLQYQFQPGSEYDIGLTNPTPRSRKFTIILSGADDSEIFKTRIKIPAGGCDLTGLPALDEPARLSVTSNLVMARPIVFKTSTSTMDVFHG